MMATIWRIGIVIILTLIVAVVLTALLYNVLLSLCCSTTEWRVAADSRLTPDRQTDRRTDGRSVYV